MKNNTIYSEFALSLGASLCATVAVVLGLVWENLGEIFIGDLIRPFTILMCITAIGTVLCALLYRPLIRVLPIALILLFSYSTVQGLIPSLAWDGPISLLLLLLIFAAIFFWSRRMEGVVVARVVLLITGAAATTMSVLVFVSEISGQAPAGEHLELDDVFSDSLQEITGDGSVDLGKLPDIIYIVPDRYGSRTTLLADFGWDNTAFYEALNNRGFFVNSDAWANYAVTAQSLASTLNSGYLDRVAEALGPDSKNQKPVYRFLEDNLAQGVLRALGYRYIHSGNWWAPTASNRNADENRIYGAGENFLWKSEFEKALWAKTPLRGIYDKLSSTSHKCEPIKRQLDYLRNVGNGPQPLFVFAHIFIPHGPITMDANGRCLEKEVTYPSLGTTWEEFKAAYVAYLRYLNAAVLDIFDAQRTARGENGREFIFVIHSDEGPHPRSMRDHGRNYDLFTMTESELQMKMGILNAIYLPKGDYSDLAEAKTPINNWRFLFNSMLGSRIDSLPEKLFIFRDSDRLYEFRDVSHLLKKPEGR